MIDDYKERWRGEEGGKEEGEMSSFWQKIGQKLEIGGRRKC